MRVRGLPGVTTRDGKPSRWPVAGEEYVVLEVVAPIFKGVGFRLEHPDGTPVVVSSTDVTIVDGRIPEGWAAASFSDAVAIGPPEWLELGFWERYFDLDAEARAAYLRGKELSEHDA